MSNRNKTNRQQGRRPRPRRRQTEWNDKGHYIYNAFYWLSDWVAYASAINDERRELAFYDAISCYGCFVIEPIFLGGDDLEYFNKHVRPELDRQHEIMRKGGRI